MRAMTIGGGGPAAPPGWYPDGPGWQRRWDGAAWTADRRPVPPPAPYSTPPPAPYSTPPPTPKRSLFGLWIALAVVGVVVIASVVTLLVVQPWSDDDGGTVGEEAGTPSTGPTEEPAAEPVRGDVDGDGLGDVVGRYYDDAEHRLTLTNAGGRFEVAQEPRASEERLVVADFDGDGLGDVGSWFDAAGTLQLQVEGTDLSLTQDFDLWPEVEAIHAVVGDFDGDGLADIAAYGQQHRSQVAVWVLRNTGDGFEEPVKWAALPNATYGSTQLIVGDYNGDAVDDALAVVPNEPLDGEDFTSYYWVGDSGIVPLIADPGSFHRGGIAPIETQLYDQERAVGDFDGDGKETLVADDYYESSLVLYEYDGTTFRPTGARVSYDVAGEGLLTALVSVDVDGNQLDDLVFTSVDVDDYSFSGVWTALADPEGGIETPTKWADIADCPVDYCDITYFPAR